MRILLFLAALALPASAIETRWLEGTLRGFPVVRDGQGRPIADGTLTQWIEDGNLHVVARYELRDGRSIEEQAVLAQRPELRQLRWGWEERRAGEVVRAFSVDLETGHAAARKRTEGG